MDPALPSRRLAVVGRGRMGAALVQQLKRAGYQVSGPLGRTYSAADLEDPEGALAEIVLLCVPDRQIAVAAAALAQSWPEAARPLVGHCSGASGLETLEPFEAFSLHPLMTVAPGASVSFDGVPAAVEGSSERALSVAGALARDLAMRPFELTPGNRAAYHAAASIASNFLVTLEAAAERLAATAGAERALLVPLVRQTVENWAFRGGVALTGPIARGDEQTVARQRAAVAERTPDLLRLFDALADATATLADAGAPPGAAAPPVAAPPRVLRTVAELRAALAAARRAGATIGLVPTMGALHEGHLSLIRRARRACDVVVMSLFVNPTQFDERSDLEAYPRDETSDLALAGDAGVDFVFAPEVSEVYPPGFATRVAVSGLTDTLEGERRGAEHFGGVATVVTKLLNMVLPDVAYFGQKDAQQAAVIRRFVRDLDLPVRVEISPTVREPDGLAMSSRNTRLSADERERAVALSRALEAAGRAAAGGERDAGELLAVARGAMRPFAVEPEYLVLVDPDTMAPVSRLDRPALLAVAARLGATRLIDNAVLAPSRTPVLAAAASVSGSPSTRTEQRCSV